MCNMLHAYGGIDMYYCNRCKNEFEEPDIEVFCYEDEYGVSGWFNDRHYGHRYECPICGSDDFEEDYEVYEDEETE